MTAAAQRRQRHSGRANPAASYGLLISLAAIILIADQILKQIVTNELSGGRTVKILAGLVQFDYTRNSGAAFGILRARGLVFALVAILVSAGIVIYYRRVAESPLIVRIALGLILGGALGNLLDRVRLGYVVDFIDLRWWPVFNLADSSIVVGVLLLTAYAVTSPGDHE